MKYSKYILYVFIALLLWYPGYAHSIPAFPGAEGFGANSVGGRGGTVIKVTNLNDSGAGSLRAAVEASGPRIIVFNVSGIINLATELFILNPYITIAGQTSPGGILVTGSPTTVITNDVIIQHVRFRLGSHNMADPETHDTFRIMGRSHQTELTHDIIIDHCSFSWGVDETFSTGWYNPTNITIQWSIIAEGLSHAGHPKGEHSKGLMISGKYESNTHVSIHHNYIAHNGDRNPQLGTAYDSQAGLVLADVVNNIIYNFKGFLSGHSRSYGHYNWVNNYIKPGLDSHPVGTVFEVIHTSSPSFTEIVYVKGNIGSKRDSQSDPEWAVGESYSGTYSNEIYRKATPWAAPSITSFEMSYNYALSILEEAGATKPVRDSVDTRITEDFVNGTGRIKDNVVYPNDFPTFSNPTPPLDNDSDGMADSWEASNGLNTSTNDSASDKDGDGYTNIEEYLHYLAGIILPSAPKNVRIVSFP